MAGNMIQWANARAALLVVDESGMSTVEYAIGTIAAAVEEQSVTTRDIAENVGQASVGVRQVNENVSQSSVVTGEIAKDIVAVSTASGHISASSTELKRSSENLSHLAGALEGLVKKFKV